MRFLSWLPFACLALGSRAWSAEAPPAASPLPDDYTITAVAPKGLRRTDLGRPYSTNFQPLTGKQGLPLFPNAADRKAEAASQFDYQLVAIDNSHELRANASGWGVSADAAFAASHRYLSYRVFLVSSVDEVDDRSDPRAASPKAAYYVRRIYYGAMIEYLCIGDADRFDASVRADFGVVSGSVGGFEKNHRTKCQVKGRGVTAPDTANALFVTNQDQIRSAYFGAKSKPVPILVEYRRIPEAPAAEYQEYPWAPQRGVALAPTVRMSVSSVDSGWQATGITLAPGDGFLLLAEGEIFLNANHSKKATPGQVEVQPGTCGPDAILRVPNGTMKVRIGRSDKNMWKLTPGGRFSYIATDDVSGPVELGILDSKYEDNDGVFTVNMIHVPANLKAPPSCVGPDACGP